MRDPAPTEPSHPEKLPNSRRDEAPQQSVSRPSVISDYQTIISRLQEEARKLRQTNEASEQSEAALRLRVQTLEGEQSVHKKIEEDLQAKIRALQQENCTFNKHRAQRAREEDLVASKFRELEQHLEGLESLQSQKEADLQHLAGECQNLQEQLSSAQAELDQAQDYIQHLEE